MRKGKEKVVRKLRIEMKRKEDPRSSMVSMIDSRLVPLGMIPIPLLAS